MIKSVSSGRPCASPVGGKPALSLPAASKRRSSFLKCVILALAVLGMSLFAVHIACGAILILEDKPSYDLSGYLDILSDPSQRLTVEQVEDRKDWMQTPPGRIPNLGFTQAAIWIRFSLAARSDAPEKVYVSFEYPVTQAVSLFTKDRQGVFSEEHTGSGMASSANVLPDRHFVFPVMIAPGETKTVYLRVQSASRMILPVRVLTDSALVRKAVRDYAIYGALLGLLALVTLYFVSVGSFLYKGTPIWLAAYGIFFGLHTAIRGGFIRMLLPDALLPINNPLQLIVIAGLFFTGAKFFRLFLSLKSRSVVLDRIMLFFQYLSLTFIILPGLPEPIIIGVSLALIVLNPLFSISLAFYFWHKGVSNAGLFAIGWIVAHCVAVYDFFRIHGFIPYQPLGEWPIPFSLFAALLFLSMALIRRNTLDHQMAETDPLTRLANRRKFDEALTEEWNRCQRLGSPLSIVMADVDHFKEYNDAHGHKAGDLCLCRVADILKSHTRRTGELAARYGGEEFILLFPHLDAASAFELSEAIRHAIGKPAMDPASRSGRKITISLGIATAVPAEGAKPEELVIKADQALYEAKRAGRNRSAAAAPA